jgi:hypothetical protein
VQPVGNYAVRLTFDDGHDTGIFTWKFPLGDRSGRKTNAGQSTSPNLRTRVISRTGLDQAFLLGFGSVYLIRCICLFRPRWKIVGLGQFPDHPCHDAADKTALFCVLAVFMVRSISV